LSTLTVTDAVRRYGEVAALDGVSLTVPEGELLCVLGPSGSGKTTLLRAVAGLERLDGGTIAIGERPVDGVAPAERGVAMVFQSYALFPHLDVEGNIGFGLAARGVATTERRARVREVGATLGLEGLLGRMPHELSGGERQRVALGRALAGRPKVLLLDEPLSNLDARLRDQMRVELRRIHDATGLTTLHVTHDQAEALSLGDRVAILRAGRLEQVGTPDEVYDAPAGRWVAGFLGSPPMQFLPDGTGVRPEHLVPDPAGELAGMLELVESAGHERLWHVRVGEQVVIARVGHEQAGAPGETVRLRALRRHRFDA
jgi:multiple sugar transport system ATP-binding protein